MKYSLSLVTLALLFSNAQAWYKPTQNDSWNISLGSKIDLSSEKAKIIEVDLENTSASTIKEYHNHNKKVICYFSGGTVEKYRSYYQQYKKVDGLVKNTYEDWDDEKWIDYRVPAYKNLLKQRMKEAVEKKCDLIDVDNVDGYQIDDTQSWSKPLTKSDAITFTKWLGDTAHSYGLGIGLKNCLDIIDTVGSHYDFAVNEGCAPKNECHWYKNFLKTGKPVLGITYYGLSKNREALCKNLNGLPITMIVKEGKSLKQKSEVFDGKKHCSSDFHVGKVDAPKEEAKTTTTKKTTTTTKKTTTTTTKKTTTTTTTVKKTTTTTTTKKTTTTTTTTTLKKTTTTTVAPKKTEIPAIPLEPAKPKQQPVSSSVKPVTTSVAVKPTSTPAVPLQPATPNQPATQNQSATAPVSAPVSAPVKQNTNAQPVKVEKQESAKVADKESPIVNGVDGNEDESGNGGAAVVGITGSVLGAAAVFAFLKKNPKKVDTIKRGFSRRATSIKRGASTLSRRVTTRSRI